MFVCLFVYLFVCLFGFGLFSLVLFGLVLVRFCLVLFCSLGGPTPEMTPGVGATETRRPGGRSPKNAAKMRQKMPLGLSSS